MKKQLLVFSLLVVAITLGQKTQLDSIENLLNTTNIDTIRLNLLLRSSELTSFDDPIQAIKKAEDAYKLANRLNYNLYKSKALLAKGTAYYRMDNLSTALSYYQKALDIALKTGNTLLQSQLLNNIANTYADLGKYDEAMAGYKDYLVMAQKSHSEKDLIVSHTNIGILLVDKDSIEKGISHLTKALDHAIKIDNVAYIAAIKNNLGLAFRRKSDFEKSKEYYNAAIKISRTQNLSHIEASALNSLAKISLIEQNFDAVKNYANQALTLAKASNAVQWQADSWELLSKVYELQKDSMALRAFKNYILLRDSILSTDKRLDFAQNEMQYQLAAQQQLNEEIIKRHTLTNTIIIAGSSTLLVMAGFGYVLYKKKRDAHEKQKLSEYKAIVAETELKALRAQMNPHFIFNSLNSIRHYIATKDISTADEYLVKFAKLTRAILENSEKKWISLKEDLELLKLYMETEKLRLTTPFTYAIYIDVDINEENTMVPPLIMQPFVENSIWHGLAPRKEKGKITINIRKDGEYLSIVIDDNGVGRKGGKATSTKRSMGLKITQNRLKIVNKQKKLNGNLKITDKTQGTQVSLKLPLEIKF